MNEQMPQPQESLSTPNPSADSPRFGEAGEATPMSRVTLDIGASAPKPSSRWLIIVVLLLAALGLGVWVWSNLTNPTTPDNHQNEDNQQPVVDTNLPNRQAVIEPPFVSSSTIILDTVSLDTTSWKTYRNEKYGFEFKYPSYLSVARKGQPSCTSEQKLSANSCARFVDNFGKVMMLVRNPLVEVGYEAWDINSKQISILNSNISLTKWLAIPKIDKSLGRFIKFFWPNQKIGDIYTSGEITIPIAPDNSLDIKIVDQIISTFRIDPSIKEPQRFYRSKITPLKAEPKTLDFFVVDNYLSDLLGLERIPTTFPTLFYDDRRTDKTEYYIELDSENAKNLDSKVYFDENYKVNISPIDSKLIPYLSSISYCQIDSDCTIRPLGCGEGSANYYKTIRPGFGCEGYQSYPYTSEDLKMCDLVTDHPVVKYGGPKCINNQCIAESRTVRCEPGSYNNSGV